VFVPGKPYQPSLMFVGKPRSLPESGTPVRCFILVYGPTHKRKTTRDRLARDKHPSLLACYEYSYIEAVKVGPCTNKLERFPKKTLGSTPSAQCYKTFYICNL
jgi:hypothetical protein